MSKIIFLLLEIFAFAPATAIAASRTGLRCEQIFIPFQVESTLVADEKNLVFNHYYSARMHLENDLVAASGLHFPESPMRVTVKPSFNRGGAFSQTLTKSIEIEVPFQWQSEDIKYVRKGESRYFQKHPKYTLVVFYHELGHAVFIENAIQTNSFLGHFLKKSAAAVKRIETSQEKIELLEKSNSEQEQKQIIAELRQIQAEFEARITYEGSFEYNRLNRVIKGLNEFFADVTAVMADGNPGALRNLNEITSPTSSGKFAKLRRQQYASRDFENPNNEISVWKESSDPHDYFAPSRYFLYETYLRYPRYRDGKAKNMLYKRIFDAIVEVVTPDLQHSDIAPREMNRRLISALQRQSL